VQSLQTDGQQKGDTAKKKHCFRDPSTTERKHPLSKRSPLGIKPSGDGALGGPR
jgi:hypothetical protein